MHLDALPEATSAVFERATRHQALSRFLLVGGTALALQDAHRISEDLDFVSPDLELDQSAIRRIVSDLADKDAPRLVTSDLARQQFDNDGMDLDVYHQDWLVDGVKVTFFVSDEADERAVHRDAGRHSVGTVSIMDADGIFALKSKLTTKRTNSRDTFDLWHFVANRGKSVQDVIDAMGDRGQHFSLDARLAKIAPNSFKEADPGFLPLRADSPQNPQQLIERMAEFAAGHRRQVAADLARLIKGPASRTPFIPDRNGPER